MPEYDWSARLSTGELITCAATMAATTATAGVYADLPALAPAAIGAAAAAGQVIYNARQAASRLAITTRAASWLVASGWTTYHVAAHAPPTSTGWITAACAGIIAAAANYAVNLTEPERQHDRALLSFKRQAVKTMDEWTERIERVTRIKGCTVLPSIQPWPEDAGYTLEVQLPLGGTTWKHIADHTDGFAADMALPEGCGVEVAKGANRGRIIIRVSTRDMISETIMYPEDYTELSINDGFSFGFHRDGTDALASLLDDCGIVVGDTGSGKTNLVNTVIAALARMRDVLVWVIDTTGAGVALPWITPWALTEEGRDQQAHAPAVDWVAHTLPEAKIMLRLAIMIISIRKARYQKLMRAHNTDKIPVSAAVPEILIIGDETAELPAELQKLIDSGMNTGRAVRVRYLNSALRATQDTITAAMKKRAKLRIGMHSEDPEELSYLFSGYQMLDMADAPVPGSGFYTNGNGAPRPFKARRLEPDAITRLTIACGDRRPSLDPISAEAALYDLYLGRWARALPALYPDDLGNFADAVEDYLRDLTDQGLNVALTGDEGKEDNAVQGALTESDDDTTGAGAPISTDQLDAMFRQAGAEAATPAVPIPIPSPSPPPPDVPASPDNQPADHQGPMGEAFERVLHQTGDPRHQTNHALVPPVKTPTLTPEARAYQLLYAAGSDGTGAKEISETLEAQNVSAPRTTVQRWLKAWTDGDDRRAVRAGSGSHTRYVHIAHAATDTGTDA